MAAKKVGELIKEARTSAGLTQEKLAAAVGLVASDVSKAERGELDLTDAALKKIAKATGVTQASLLNAPKGGVKAASAKSTTAKSTTAKSTTAKSTTTKTAAAKSTASKATTTKAATKTPANANTSMKVTASEKKLIELYRAASANEKKAAAKLLQGDCPDMVTTIIGGSAAGAISDNMADLIGDVVGSLLGVKR